MTKHSVSEKGAAADIKIFIRAVHAIQDGRVTHPPGSVFAVSPDDADMLIKAGAAERPESEVTPGIEDILPVGMDPKIWIADPRCKISGQRSASFVKRAEFEAFYNANRR